MLHTPNSCVRVVEFWYTNKNGVVERKRQLAVII